MAITTLAWVPEQNPNQSLVRQPENRGPTATCAATSAQNFGVKELPQPQLDAEFGFCTTCTQQPRLVNRVSAYHRMNVQRLVKSVKHDHQLWAPSSHKAKLCIQLRAATSTLAFPPHHHRRKR